jgi:hypothetical protein
MSSRACIGDLRIRATFIVPALAVAAIMAGAGSLILAAEAAAPDARVPGLVKGIKALPDKAVDCTSLKAIVDSVTRGCKTNDDKAVAIYNFMLLGHYHRAYPEGGPVLREINSFGWSLCGGLQAEQSALWRAAGWKWRFVGWKGHTTGEAYYDDKWHYLDTFLKFYCWAPDAAAPGGRTIASQEAIAAGADSLMAAYVEKGGAYYIKDDLYEAVGGKGNWMAQSFLNCGDDLKGCFEGSAYGAKHPGGPDEGWMGQQHATGDYSADLDLPPGGSLTNTWDGLPDGWYWPGNKNGPAHTCPNNKDLRTNPSAGLVLEPYFKRQRSWTNGTLAFAPDLAAAGVLESFYASENAKANGGAIVPAEAGKPASVTVLLQSPYVMVKGSGAAEGADSFEVTSEKSFKLADLKTFKAADIKDFSTTVNGKTLALVKVGFKTALKSLRLDVVVENNSGALPFLSPGKNSVTVSVADPAALGANKLVVTFAYAPGFRTTSLDQICLEGKRVAAQINATWAETPTVVQKTFAAKDLPAKFDIDVATPRSKFPVYPRMIFVRREVVAPGAKPLPLPDKAEAPKAGPEDELKTLPDPFLMGTRTGKQNVELK